MSRSSQFETKIETTRRALLERQHLQARLQDLFLSLQGGSLYMQKLPGDKRESLIAIFDYGIDPDPAFSGPILARIYLDEKNNLAIALWPLGKEKTRPWRSEILFSEIQDFQFQLLGKKTQEGIAPVNAQLSWYDRWPKERLDTPSMIRLMIRQKNVSFSYAFFTANPEPLVTYWESGYF